MFGRKIPDKVMAPTGSPAGAEPQRLEKKTMSGPTVSRNEAPVRRTSAVESIIGEDTSFQGGKILSKGMLRIDGRVESEIMAEDAVVVGQSGAVKGNITARAVAISGKVFGNVIAHERLEIQPTGEVHGDVHTAAGALIIDGGAKLEGKCIMGLTERVPAAAAHAQAATTERRVPVEANPRPENAQPRREA